MDNSVQQQSVIQEPPIVSKHFYLPRVLLVLLVALITAAISGYIFFMVGKVSNQSQTTTSTTVKNTAQTKALFQPTTTISPTITPVDTSNWKTFTQVVPIDNTPNYGYPSFTISMQYPPDMTVKESHTLSNRTVDNPAEINTAVISGKEGNIQIEWGPMGFGGGCDPSMHMMFHIKNMTVNICHNIANDGTEMWSGIGSVTAKGVANPNQPTEANATANPPLNINSPVIQTMLTTLVYQ